VADAQVDPDPHSATPNMSRKLGGRLVLVRVSWILWGGPART
jgi:hypothetical protein